MNWFIIAQLFLPLNYNSFYLTFYHINLDSEDTKKIIYPIICAFFRCRNANLNEIKILMGIDIVSYLQTQQVKTEQIKTSNATTDSIFICIIICTLIQ